MFGTTFRGEDLKSTLDPASFQGCCVWSAHFEYYGTEIILR